MKYSNINGNNANDTDQFEVRQGLWIGGDAKVQTRACVDNAASSSWSCDVVIMVGSSDAVPLPNPHIERESGHPQFHIVISTPITNIKYVCPLRALFLLINN
jgi:hypothetical protein